MRPIRRAVQRKASLSFGGAGTFSQPPHWLQPDMWWSSLQGDKETIERDFGGYVAGAYKGNGIVFACILARLLVFSEARFQYQRFVGGRPGDLFGDQSLRLLEEPWPNGTTGELLARMEQDASLAGNFFATIRGQGDQRRIRRLRPDWVTIITGSPSDNPFDLDAQVVGYLYQPQDGTAPRPVLLTAAEVAHYSPIPDPEAQWRGMSWLTPVCREIEADSAATKHKLKFFENAATTPFVVTYDPSVSPDAVRAAAAFYKEQHAGTDNAYKTLHMGGGADVTTVGANLRQLDFKVTQGAGETRIAAAAGVGAVIANLSEGLQGSSLNSGNYNAARRRFADGTVRPLWRIASAALSKLVTVPGGSRLWYDARDIPFLSEDAKDAAEIQQIHAASINTFITAGFTADSAVAAVTAGDLKLLKHSGLTSVQLQAPGTPTSNGNGSAVPVPV